MMIRIEGRTKAGHMSNMAGQKNLVKDAAVEKETS